MTKIKDGKNEITMNLQTIAERDALIDRLKEQIKTAEIEKENKELEFKREK